MVQPLLGEELVVFFHLPDYAVNLRFVGELELRDGSDDFRFQVQVGFVASDWLELRPCERLQLGIIAHPSDLVKGEWVALDFAAATLIVDLA